MTTMRNWLGGFVAVLAGIPRSTRWMTSAPGTVHRAQQKNWEIATRPAGDSRYGAWLAETVTYHH